MKIAIAGGHGQIALLLGASLAADGHDVVGLIRDASQASDLRERGIEAAVVDLEDAGQDEVASAISGADAVVFAAGAGPGSGPERKWTVDYGGAVALMEGADAAGVQRYVMISAMGTDDPPDDDRVFSVYLRAKAKADQALQATNLAWTIVRPGRLTDDPPAGTVTLARHVDRGEIPRGDVAAVVHACLTEPRTVGQIFEVVGGHTPIPDALASL